MKKRLFLAFAFFCLLSLTAAAPAVTIDSLQAGQVLRGKVPIRGTVPAEGFVSGEVSYAYAQQGTVTWFLIGKFTQPVAGATLVTWDTSTISDGDYQIKVTAQYQDGTTLEATVQPVYVRNYTAIPAAPTLTTNIASAGQPVTAAPTTPSNTSAPVVTVTPFPANPAALSFSQIGLSLRIGIFAGALVLAALGIYALFHYLIYHR